MHSRPRRVGIDVSKDGLDVCAESKEGDRRGQFENSPEGIRALIKWMGKKSAACVEATGVYHLHLCLALRKAGIDVMVINPRVARNFAVSLSVRTKTDRVDSWTLLEYLKRMEFVAWQAPSSEVLELRDLARRLEDLIQAASDEKKRQHAFATGGAARFVLNDVEVNLTHLKRRIALTEKAAVSLIKSDQRLKEKFDALRTIIGIGVRSAILLLAELLPLDPAMTVREIVAYAGLDPREEQSGTQRKRARISRIGNKRLRTVLFLPAMTLSVRNKHARAFCDRLVGRGKQKMQAIVAIMRKLLHVVWKIMGTLEKFDSSRLFPVDAARVAQMGNREAMAESPDSAIGATQPEAKKSHPKGRSEAEERQLDSSQTEATGGRRTRRAA